jgi:CRISPR-associated protein Cmr4
MYEKAYGIIETLAPLHVGASAGEETGNLNLIFREQFTQTGIIPGSSIRGRFRADMRQENGNYEDWYGKEAVNGKSDSTSEGIVKFEYASILWLPIYCPGQPIVLVTCPLLLKRYQKLTGQARQNIEPYSYFLPPNLKKPSRPTLFFNLGCLPLKTEEPKLKSYIPEEIQSAQEYLVLVVKDTEIATIHDMGLYRQSRVALDKEQKTVAGTSFFNVEALPEGTILVFPIALRNNDNDANLWNNFLQASKMNAGKGLYFGGLESVGFGHTNVIVKKTPEN